MVNRPLDQQRVGDLVAEFPPAAELSVVPRVPADEVAERAVLAAVDQALQALLVLIEAVAHRDRHPLVAVLERMIFNEEIKQDCGTVACRPIDESSVEVGEGLFQAALQLFS